MSNDTQPEIRFPGFTEDWEEHKLKDVVEKQIKGKAQFEKLAPGDVEYLDTSRLNGGQAILTNGLKDVTLDDVLILWDGSKAGTVYHGFEGSLGSTLKAYRTSADSKFVYQYLKRYQDNIYNNYRTPNIPHVQKDFLDVFTISVPRSDEQAKIGSFFKQLDDTIALHQRKLDLLKETKKGFLQKMFPKNGAKVPEIRFPGFTEDWEQRKLSEMAGFSKGNGYSKADLVEKGHPVILYGRLYTKYETVIEKVDTFAELKEKSVISNGGEVIVPASGETPEDISRASVVDVSGVALGGDLNIIKTKSELDPTFLALTISNGSQQKEMTKRAQGKSVVHLHNSDLKEVNLLYPKLDEQVKIGSFFKKLDVAITLHQRKLDLLKETKKGFLQKMFV